MNRLYFTLLFVIALFFIKGAKSQNKLAYRFTKLSLETRCDFDYAGNYNNHDALQQVTFDNDYGFNGKYFNLAVGGEFADKFSYYFRQRIIANKGASSLFDNTDFLYLNYKINDNWSVRGGKEALRIGGFEYDAAPIDVYYYSKFWGAIPCFQLGASMIFTDNSQRNQLVLQVSNSPYIYFAGTGNEWKQGYLGYSFYWSGNYEHFKTLYSVNFFQRKPACYVNYLSLGNKLVFDKWTWYVDYINRVTDVKKSFSDFSVITRFDMVLKDVNIFVKAGYDQNLAEEANFIEPRDIMVSPGECYYYYGLGLEYRHATYKNVRLHVYVCNAQTIDKYKNNKFGKLCANVGLTWNLDFLTLLHK